MYETLFTTANLLAALPWFLMILAPGWRGTRAVTATPLVPLAFALFYLALLVFHWGSGDGGMDSLASVRRGFERDGILLLGWVHYLCFDMMVGFWEFRDSRRLGIPHLALVPCLVFSFVLGPVGLLLYVGVRWVSARRFAFGVREAQTATRD